MAPPSQQSQQSKQKGENRIMNKWEDKLGRKQTNKQKTGCFVCSDLLFKDYA